MPIKRLMIVDDSDAEQFLCRHLIKSYDSTIEIVQVYDGVQALETLSTSDVLPDVILLDINMPRMNGLEFLEHFHTLYDNSAVKLAMLSSSVREKNLVSKFPKVCDYFEKPLSKSHLDMLSDQGMEN